MNLRGEEESVIADDEDAIIDDDIQSNRRNALGTNPPKNLVEREPEREPDFSRNLEANISYNDHRVNQRQIHQSNIPTASKQQKANSMEEA